MLMKISDYIVSFLAEKNVTHVFGYPGGMVTHLMDSLDRCGDKISAHVNCHEQGSAFCACGYAQTCHRPGCAYATSGPGATNLITGIADAYYDSIPCLFITGQVNTYESKGDLSVRQKGFQETDIVNIVKSITKYVSRVDNAEMIKYELEKAYVMAVKGRPGPVLLDIPMNIQRAEIDPQQLVGFSELSPEDHVDYGGIVKMLLETLSNAERPLLIGGAGIDAAGMVQEFRDFVEASGIPVVTSMVGVDLLPSDSACRLGFLGAYGHRVANLAVAKSDLILSLGSRLDCRQTGANLGAFAPDARLIRVEIDRDEATNRIKADEVLVTADLKRLLPLMNAGPKYTMRDRFSNWRAHCSEMMWKLAGIDDRQPNQIIRAISEMIPDGAAVTTDVGQNQVWVAQSFIVKEHQRILFSGGHGAMGYSLPAAIGAYYADGRPVVCFCGDGGLQMNIQELQLIAREKIPIKIVLLNNYSLGMIRHFQEMYFESNYSQTVPEKGYTAPNFHKIADAYGIDYFESEGAESVAALKAVLESDRAALIEIRLTGNTYVFPKLSMGRPPYDQDPLMERTLLDSLMAPPHKGAPIGAETE